MATKAAAKKGAKKATKAAKPAREAQPNKNGVTRPRDGGKTSSVWDIADGISSKTREPAKRADVLAAAEKKGINNATAATQYGKWRRYNGLKKDAAAPRATKAAAKKGAKKATKRARKTAPAAEAQTEQSEE